MKAKRTYRISVEAIETVRRLADGDALDLTQDAVVERAILELERALDDARDAARWTEAATDPEFLAENALWDSLPDDTSDE